LRRHVSVVSFPAGIKHDYRNLQQAECLMKQGVVESYAPGVRLYEWEEDGSNELNSLFKHLQGNDWPAWDASHNHSSPCAMQQ